MHGMHTTQLSIFLLCAYHCKPPPTPGRAMVGIGGDLQKLFDKFPTPGDNFMLQIPYYPLGMRWGFVRN